MKAKSKTATSGTEKSKTNGKAQADGKSYKLADGSQSTTKTLKGKTEGDFHYYAPRKAVVKHEVGQQEAVEPIMALINSGKFWKIRLWTAEGIHSAKTFKGKTSLVAARVKAKVNGKARVEPKAIPQKKAKVMESKLEEAKKLAVEVGKVAVTA